MSHCDRILAALRDGQWHTTADLYRATGGFLILHSRISDLRHKGHNVEGRHVPGRSGADGYEYRLAAFVTFIDVPKVRRPVERSPAVPAAEKLHVQITFDDSAFQSALAPFFPAAHYDI